MQSGTLRTALATRVAIGLVLLVGAALRLGRLDLVEFKSDESTWLIFAEDLVRRGQVPLAGMRSSQGIADPPHFAYLLAPLVAISRAPELATGAIALANVAAVVAVAWLAWRGLGPLAALVATLLYAFNPWAVFWARKIWQPDLMPPFTVLLLICLELGVVQRRLRWAAVALPLGVFASLVHLSFAVLLPLLLLPLGVLLRARRWRLLAIAAVTCALVVLPSIVYEQQVGWQDYRDLRYFQSQRSATNLVGLGYSLELISGWDARTLVNVPLERFASQPLVTTAGLVELALLAAAAALAIRRLVQNQITSAERVRIGMLLGCLVLPVALTLRHNMLVYPHYYLVVLPAAFVLIGSLASWQRVFVGIAAMVACAQIVTTLQFFGYVSATNPNCFYGLPLGRTRELSDAAGALADRTGTAQLSLETGGMEIGYLLRTRFARIQLPDMLLPTPGSPSSASVPVAAGVHVLGDWQGELSVADGTPRVAIAWQAGGDLPSDRRVHWQMSLGEGGVAQDGLEHSLGEVQAQPLVSLLTVEVPRGLAAGAYPLRAQLVETNSGLPVQITLPDGSATSDWTVGTVHAFSGPGCEPEESAL